MQIPLLSGVVGTKAAEFVQSLPLNLEPVIIDSKISKGQFRAPAGASTLATGPGIDRGGVTWRDQHYRVMGTKLVRVDGTALTELGDVGGYGYVALDYSFDRLIIGSAPGLYYWNNVALTQVTDSDLGVVIDAIWIDGYTMTTDGTYVVVTELNDPTQVKPLKYGSAEQDPDPVTGLIRYRDEVYVMGRHTIQTLRNVGGSGFPFETLKGALLPVGCVAPAAKCLFGDGFAFVGSARGDALNVYLAGSGGFKPIGNRAICDALAAVTDETAISIEARVSRGESRLIVHLPGASYCFLLGASEAAGELLWHKLTSASGDYRLRHGVQFLNRTFVGDLNSAVLGELTDSDHRHFGSEPPWEFVVGLIYNEGRGGILHALELIGLPGRGWGDGSVFLSMTRDGQTWSTERALATKPGLAGKRLQWRPHARFGAWLGIKFRGVGGGLPGIAAVEVTSIAGLSQ